MRSEASLMTRERSTSLNRALKGFASPEQSRNPAFLRRRANFRLWAHDQCETLRVHSGNEADPHRPCG